jgi:seryl-tRNA synthetase
LPNLTSSNTPREGSGQVLEYINYDPACPPKFDLGADHSKIGEALDLIEFAAAGQTSGWGFYYLRNEGALLEHALVQYALAVARKRGWMMVTPPSLVYSHMAESCGFQPRDQNDEQQIWQVAQPEKDAAKPKRSLAATAEIPLAGLYASKAIPEDELPIKVIGSSRCYRAEAGARGVDTRGLYRVHEFTKVEMFAWAGGTELAESGDYGASDSGSVFVEMVEIQKEILSSLGLPCRILEMPASDLGASAFRKIDIEAVFPSRMSRDDGWGELTSVSMCTDYQSRRLDTRIFDRSGSRKRFAHTLNGTAMAVPRVLAAILEHGWRQEEKCVVIPTVLVPYMGGLDRITAQCTTKR